MHFVNKKRAWIALFFVAIFVATWFAPVLNLAYAEDKHPRVAELEDQLRVAATDYFKARFPQIPFLMTVNIIPMRRLATANDDKSESLPYMDFSGEEIQDEWDDPESTSQSLIQRSNRITIEISLSDAVSDSDAGEAKENLFRTLHLTPGRDEIRVNLRKWVQTTTTESRFDPVMVGSALIIVLSLVLGLYFIQWRSDRKPKKFIDATTNGAAPSKSSKDSAPAFTMAPPPPVQSLASKKSESTHHSGGGSVGNGFNAFQAQSWVHETVKRIVTAPSFPALELMTALDSFGEKNPRGLGAVLQEFPEGERKLLFSLGESNAWLVAMSDPGELGTDEASFIKRLSRITSHRSRKKEDLLIALWRLKGDMPQFVRGLPKDMVLRVLRLLPAHMTVQVARQAFPGAWADVLDFEADRNSDFETSSEGEIDNLIERAFQIKPRMEIHSAVVAKKERELMEYLRHANPSEEREIYLAAGARLPLISARPAFYRVVESSSENVAQWVGSISMDQWAKALCNLNRNERNVIFKSMTDKQAALLREMIRRFEMEHVSVEDIGDARENIARMHQHYENQRSSQTAQDSNPTPSADSQENVDEIKNAA